MEEPEKQRVRKILREAPGMSWGIKYTKLSKKDRKAILGPILEVTEDIQSKRALRVFLKYGHEELERIAGSKGNLWRLFCWEWLLEYKREGMRKLKLTREGRLTLHELGVFGVK